MNFRNLLRNKGLVFAISALLGLFLLFLLIINIIQNNSVSYIRHVDVIDGVTSRLSSNVYDNNIAALDKDIKQLSSNGELVGESASQFNSLLSAVSKQKKATSSTDLSDIKSKLTQLKSSLVAERDKKSGLALYMQIAAAVISLLFVLLIIFPLISRVAKEEETGSEAKRETEGIMSTITEGLFLLSTDNEFGIEQSASLKEMFRSDRDLEGDFFDFIRNYVPQSTIQIAKDYLDLLYGERVKEKLVKDLNPLNEVEINIARRDGSFESRFLNFKFSRVMIDNKLSQLITS